MSFVRQFCSKCHCELWRDGGRGFAAPRVAELRGHSHRSETAGHRLICPQAKPEPANRLASTDSVDFPTRKVVIEATKSPVNYVVLDGPKGNTWEEALAYYLEHDARVASFVKNDHLDFVIPYVYEGVAHEFWPDFLVRLHTTADDSVVRTLIVEVSGGRMDQDKRATKALTARDSWCVAVNNYAGYGRWSFVEVGDMTTFQKVMDAAIADLYADGVTTGGVDL